MRAMVCMAAFAPPKTKQGLAAARTRPCTPSLSSKLLSDCQPGVACDAALFRSEKTLTIRNTWFPDWTQIRMVRAVQQFVPSVFG